jgi:hypothetical protein
MKKEARPVFFIFVAVSTPRAIEHTQDLGFVRRNYCRYLHVRGDDFRVF